MKKTTFILNVLYMYLCSPKVLYEYAVKSSQKKIINLMVEMKIITFKPTVLKKQIYSI